jgi:hypothetical protein
MILKRYRLVEVEESERNSAIQAATVLAPEGENSLAKVQGRSRADSIHSEIRRHSERS